MSYILLLTYILIAIFIIYKVKFFQSSYFPKYIPVIVFLLKLMGGVAVFIVYSKYYGMRGMSDIFKYYDDGNIIYSSLNQNPWDYFRMVTGIGGHAEHLNKYYHTCSFWVKDFNYGLINDNRIVIRFNAIVRLFSLGNFHIHTLIMSFISFTGLWAIFKIFEKKFSKQKWLLLLSVFFFPSVYFWTSGLLKEGILMFAFGLLLYHLNKSLDGFSIHHIIWIILTALILLLSKFYVLVAALPGILFILLIHFSGMQKFWIKLISTIIIFFLFTWFSEFFTGLNFPKILANKQHDFIAYTESMKIVGSQVEIPVLEPNLRSIITNSPSALLRTLFRPTVFEINNMMSFMAAIENLVIALCLMFSLFFISRKEIRNVWFWFCILFVIVLFTLSGLTTPVLGALVRYKTPALPFLGIAMLYVINFDKLYNKNLLRQFKNLKK